MKDSALRRFTSVETSVVRGPRGTTTIKQVLTEKRRVRKGDRIAINGRPYVVKGAEVGVLGERRPGVVGLIVEPVAK